MSRFIFVIVLFISMVMMGCQGGQLATPEADSPEGGTTAPANPAVDVIPTVSDAEAERFAEAVVNAEEDGVHTDNIEGMEPYLQEVELSTDRYIQIQRGMQLDADLYNSIQEKIEEFRDQRTEE